MIPKTAIVAGVGLAIVAAWPSHARVKTISEDKPAVVRVVEKNASVTTAHETATAASLEVHDIFVRGERTRVRVEVAAGAKAVLVLFPGGKGITKLTDTGELRAAHGNFLIRTRTYFLQRGFTIAVPDAPTDRRYDLRDGFRATADHATDIGAVIKHVRARYDLPVWLIGTSRGTTSVSSAATQLEVHKPDGIVLSASMFVDVNNGDHVFDFSWEGVSIPVLVVHHVDDGCWATPAGEIPRFRRYAVNANPLSVQLHEGGIDKGRACGPRGHHGFGGIEERVIDDIANWIVNPRPL